MYLKDLCDKSFYNIWLQIFKIIDEQKKLEVKRSKKYKNLQKNLAAAPSKMFIVILRILTKLLCFQTYHTTMIVIAVMLQKH